MRSLPQASLRIRCVPSPKRVYVPNGGSNTVHVIDPKTFKVINHFTAGRPPQHVIPSLDLKRFWVLNDLGDSLTPIGPATGRIRKGWPAAFLSERWLRHLSWPRGRLST